DQTDLSERKLAAAIHRLEDVGAIRLLPTGEIMLTRNADVEIAGAAAAEEQENRREMKRARLRQVQEYVETSACRREFLLNYFGDRYTPPCNNCDNCEALYPKSSVDPALGTRREVA
ncbi:MAG: RecQ family zinc-binding domain-containing protein, partial [Acidobacteriaceae bacterium]|nr:RecQ family zinc-binding domain-containing protein [Acidobacteriaceae bacterium]